MNETGDVWDQSEHKGDAEVLFLIEQVCCHLFWICVFRAEMRKSQGRW